MEPLDYLRLDSVVSGWSKGDRWRTNVERTRQFVGLTTPEKKHTDSTQKTRHSLKRDTRACVWTVVEKHFAFCGGTLLRRLAPTAKPWKDQRVWRSWFVPCCIGGVLSPLGPPRGQKPNRDNIRDFFVCVAGGGEGGRGAQILV